MKAWGLILFIAMACATFAGCAMPRDSPRARGGELSFPSAPVPDRSEPFRADTGVGVIRGAFAPGRQPDGNSVILAGRDGLIIFDTGRHAAHTQKIVDYARAQGRPIIAIINSHWHLDHISGNIALRRQWPGAAVYSNDAALREALGSYLARGLEENRKAAADPATPPGLVDDLRGDIATVEQAAALHPTLSLETARTLVIDGRKLDIHTARAASGGDLWVYDPATKLVLTGDLVTLPAPFLDTACPANWRTELEAVLALPFERAVPGHGREMTRAEIVLYLEAFSALLECAASDRTAESCAEEWASSVRPLLDPQSGDVAAASRYARYYVGTKLRNSAAEPWCG